MTVIAGRIGGRRKLTRRAMSRISIGIFAILMLYPLIWMVGSSFKPENQIFSSVSPLPFHGFTLSGYRVGWSALGSPFWIYFVNSGIICLFSIVGNLLSCSLTAFAFARLRFPGRGLMFALMLGTIMLPFHALIVPQFILFRTLNWTDTYLPLIVPKFFAVDAFFVFLMVQFMRSLPRELDESATIDGCGPFAIYWRIILPLCVPALATAAVFTFIFTYNDFFSQLLYISSTNKFTVPLALSAFVSAKATSNYSGLLAMSTLALAPVIALFIAFQRFLLEGIATTGLK